MNLAIVDRESAPFPTLIGTLDAIHLAGAMAAREIPDLHVATPDAPFGLAARSVGFGVLGVM